ncbi:MAG TPA: PAS domain S-box protein [Polyangiaceae bacterium]
MGGAPPVVDALSRWLTAEGLVTLDLITREALDIVGVLDPDLNVRYLSRTAVDVAREDMVGQSVLELVPPGYREVARDAYTEALRTGRGTRFETIYNDRGNLLIWEVRVGPIRFEGRVIGLIVLTDDVTELRREHADRDRFFSLSLDLLVVASPNGYFRRVNPAFGEALGYTPDELTDVPFVEFVHPEDRARTLDVFATIRGGILVNDFENRYRRKDGGYRVFSWRSTVDPVTNDVYAVARDITEQRATETQLRHAQKMEAVGQLAGGVAHDFNNLLLAILANAELAMAGVSASSQTAEHLTEIESAGRRAADLTKQLLAFSRGQPFRPVPVDLNQLIQSLMKLVRRLLPENIIIDLIPGHNLASVSADPSQLEQVIVNLCVNARDAMDRGGQLTIETENVLVNARYCEAHSWARPGRYVLLSVTDTGSGMTPEVRERAFEPFFTTKGPQQGTGLGLSTVYGIVRQHGGMVSIYSEPGQGTTFKIYLPADSRLATDVGSKLQSAPPSGQEVILLAEDDSRVRKAVIQILQRAGYRTMAAADGREAVRLLREQPDAVHLVILDVVMPELGGPETWQLMREVQPGLRAIFTSGYADRRYLKRLPPDADVLGKPFRAEELLSRIRKRLDE